MEAALEEERREVEALVAARGGNLARPASALSGGRSSSPYTPRSPVRSMLDIGEKSPLYYPNPRRRRCHAPRLTKSLSMFNRPYATDNATTCSEYAGYGRPSSI